MIRWLLPFLAFCTLANAFEPSVWQRTPLAGAPISILVPKGWKRQQAARRHPGFDEAETGWQLQSLHWPKRGASRLILYLKRGDITVYYSHNNPDPAYKTLDDYILHETTGRLPEAEQYGKWKGYTVRLIALKGQNRHPPEEAAFGDLAVHAIEFGPKEYLAVSLHAHPDAMEDYLRYFYKVRDSVRYVRQQTSKPQKTPLSPMATDAGNAPSPDQKLILLPSVAHNNLGQGFYSFTRVLHCPQNTIPIPSNWPRPGAFVCQPANIRNPSNEP